MTDSKRRFKTIIAGKTYTIVGNKSADHLTAVSGLVNKQLDQIKEAAPTLGAEERGILVAVNAVSDQITKQVEIEELKAKIAALEEELKEVATQRAVAKDSAQRQLKTEASNEENEGESAIVASAPKYIAESGNKEGIATTVTEAAPTSKVETKKTAVSHANAKSQIKKISKTERVVATPATITELQQAARSAAQAKPSGASASNSKLNRTTTASEAALKKAQQNSNGPITRAIKQDNDKNMPPYTKNKMKNENK